MPTSSDVVRAKRRAVGGRRLRCRKGKSCSAACINRNKYCLVDAPTPVAGALPRAVKAIQSRKEKLGPREKRQALQKRREHIKEKARGYSNAREQRSKYLRVRGALQRKIDEAALEEDKYRFTDLMKKLQRMEEGAGSRLGVPKAKAEDYLTRRDRLQGRRKKFENMMYDLVGSMKVASNAGRRGEYDKLERKLLKIKAKLENGLFWKDFFKYRDPVEKGSIWKEGAKDREKRRVTRLSERFKALKLSAERAAESKDRGRYNRLEEAILKIQAKSSGRIGLYEHEKIKKGELWTLGRLTSSAPQLTERYIKSMQQALEAGDLGKYNRLESKLLAVKSKLDDKDRLYLFPQLRAVYQNSLIKEYVPLLRDKMRKAAVEGDRREYNKLEQRLLKLTPGGTNRKGEIWAQQRVNGALDKLKGELEKAIRDNDRERYDKLEERLFRIRNKVGASAIRDSTMRTMTRGQMWKETKGSDAIQELSYQLNKGRREGVSNIDVRSSGYSAFYVSSDVLGNKLVISVNPNDSTSFTVNGSHTASETLSKREQIAIIRESRRQYDEIFRNMEEGTVFMVTAAEGDNRKEMRERGYTDRGFSEPDYDGRMYGMVSRGRIVPIDEGEYDDARARGGFD